MYFPFKTMIALSVLSFVMISNPPLGIKFARTRDDVKRCEFYPLSSFSMYSTFSDNPFCVYLTDGSGKMLGSLTQLGVFASDLKKTYERELKEIRAQAKPKPAGGLMDMPLALRQQAGNAALAFVFQRPVAEKFFTVSTSKTLRLHEIVLTAEADGVHRRDTMVAELTAP